MTGQERATQDHGDQLPEEGSCRCIPEVSGGGPPPQCWLQRASDRDRLAHACAVLRHYAIEAHPCLGAHGPARTRRRIREQQLSSFPGSDCAYLFWTQAEDARCLGPDGTLAAPLLAHVEGPAIVQSARAAFDLVGLTAEPGTEPGTLLVSRR